jgi:hypothetical protein
VQHAWAAPAGRSLIKKGEGIIQRGNDLALQLAKERFLAWAGNVGTGIFGNCQKDYGKQCKPCREPAPPCASAAGHCRRRLIILVPYIDTQRPATQPSNIMLAALLGKFVAARISPNPL